ncbi:MAG: hypothetical protein KGL46_04715 [Hyphomicrobiales bacterium]|nr:hypothetical protein [Hyphomicrobiales bacterium]
MQVNLIKQLPSFTCDHLAACQPRCVPAWFDLDSEKIAAAQYDAIRGKVVNFARDAIDEQEARRAQQRHAAQSCARLQRNFGLPIIIEM